MEAYVHRMARQPASGRAASLLRRIVADPGLHGRLVNTFARLEYVGVRKMIKARRAEALDVDGLQHALEEAGHALRLKRLALQLDPSAATFAAAHTLAGDESEDYFQAVDSAAEELLAGLPDARRTEINYLLTSAVIEIRAQAFYPLYEAALQAAGAPFSIAAIQRDEDRHLAAMAAHLGASLPDWRDRLEPLLEVEERLFDRWMQALERSATPAEAPTA